ncbi:hypothetical protein JCM10449v2_000444 [Rhodotorula kratochvilovae]
MRAALLLAALSAAPAALASHSLSAAASAAQLERRIQTAPSECGLSASKHQLYRNPLKGTCVAHCPFGYYGVEQTKTCTKCASVFGKAVRTCDKDGAKSCNDDANGIPFVLEARQCLRLARHYDDHVCCGDDHDDDDDACHDYHDGHDYEPGDQQHFDSYHDPHDDTALHGDLDDDHLVVDDNDYLFDDDDDDRLLHDYDNYNVDDHFGWSYQGCWRDLAFDGRVLPNGLTSKASYTVESCLAACASKGYAICRLEYKGECWGAPGVPRWTEPVNECTLPCKNDPTALCGGNAALTVYVSESIPWVQPVPNEELASYSGYDYQGCHSDLVINQARVLPRQHTNTEGRVESCLEFCASKNAPYCGLEYYGECWYALPGETLAPASQPVAEELCRFSCRGAPYEDCGGKASLSLWKLAEAPPPAVVTYRA